MSTSLEGEFRGCPLGGPLGSHRARRPPWHLLSLHPPSCGPLSHPMFLPPQGHPDPSSLGLSQELLKAGGLLRRKKGLTDFTGRGPLLPIRQQGWVRVRAIHSLQVQRPWGGEGHGIWEGTSSRISRKPGCWTPGVGARRMTYR